MTMLYLLYECQHAALAPARFMAGALKQAFDSPQAAPFIFSKNISASCELFERVTRRFGKPEFGLTDVTIGDKTYAIQEQLMAERPFCDLIHFQKQSFTDHQPKILVVAPMSGHHATLLRDTVRALLPDHDVYVTDWQDARDVPLSQGGFNFDDQTQYIIDFIHYLGPNVHVLAVCQPSVQVLAAAAVLGQKKDPKRPKSIILMGGPIDTRINPGPVNNFSKLYPLAWFTNNMIMTVPMTYQGMGRRVYPGFLQLAGFMGLQPDRHIMAHIDFFNHLVEGDDESATAHRRFYDEYLSVMDLTEEFFLESIEKVFHNHDLPQGRLTFRGEKVDPTAITETALLTIEGEKDDISPPGQTKAAHTLCTSLPKNKKFHLLQPDVGHYGIFNGRKWRNLIMPKIREFIKTIEGV